MFSIAKTSPIIVLFSWLRSIISKVSVSLSSDRFARESNKFCLPSIHEGFPLSLLEALSMGLIIVASNTGGIPEAIIENENGYLFKPKNIKQLSLKLLKALNLSYDEIVQIQKNNIQKAYRTYSWEKIVDEIIKIYIESN